MAPRLAPLDGSLVTFAHRGASAHAPENTLEAFSLAIKLGAGGLESDVWLTADGEPVLVHDGRVGSRLRRRPIAELNRADLPAHIPSLAELYQTIDPAVTPLSLDVKDPAAFEAVITAARAVDDGAEQHLWLCSPDIECLTAWRHHTTARLVSSVRLKNLDRRPEQWVALLRERGVDGLNLPHQEWNGGLVTLAHRFDRYAFGWGAQHERELASVIDAGIDGVYSDHVDRMVAVANQFFTP